MAGNLIDDYGAFDNNAERGSKNDAGSLFKRFFSFLTNRYLVLGVGFVTFGVIILVMTTKLQFSDYQNTLSESSSGVVRQYVSQAPRGDIYDSRGVLLASTTEYNSVMLANAYLDDKELNALCLELSYLFDEYHCMVVSDLDQYYVLDPAARFVKDEEKIRLWQTDSNLFDLKDYSQGVIVTFSDDYVKTDPNVFFLYLRRKFNIDNNYTIEEAYRIIRIRYQIFSDNWAFIKGTPVKIASNVPDELIRIFEEQNYHYMGIVACKEYARNYTTEALYACHVLGYVGKISSVTYSDLAPFGYTSDDMVGKSGVESQMERYLHGSSGITPYNIWTKNGEDSLFVPQSYGVAPQEGATVYLTIDSRIQEVGIQALKEYILQEKESDVSGYKTASAGAFVMMNVNTGAVIAMGSYPNYDPNDFILANYGDEQAQEQVKYYLGVDEKYQEITANDLPLWNRAIMSMYAPGSTFKPCTALAGLENGVITPTNNTITCVSPYDIDGWIFKCLEYPDYGHGPLTLNDAMAQSCNIYFMILGTRTGIDNISAMANRFGLGVKSGIDLPGEIPGVMSSREYKRLTRQSVYDKTWFPSNTAQASIGQFDNCFTILQLCRYTCGIATNKLCTPYVIDRVVAGNGAILYQGQTESVDIGISEENINAVRTAMRCVATGTYHWNSSAHGQFNNYPVEMVCKTGTAETGFEDSRKEYSNGLFICYAPKDNPEVALALVVEKGKWGSSSVVIAKKIMAAYFNAQVDSSVALYTRNPILGDYLPSNSRRG
jgi:penicillin-binding protein 2